MTEKYPFEQAAQIMKVIAHPVRLNILLLLEKSELNVREIQIGIKSKQSITSQHLMAMANKGILDRDRRANEVYYSIKRKEVLNILFCIKGCCERKEK